MAKLYTSTQIAIGTLLGSPFSTSIFLKQNFSVSENGENRKEEIVFWIVFGMVIVILMPWRIWDEILVYLMPPIYSLLAFMHASKHDWAKRKITKVDIRSWLDMCVVSCYGILIQFALFIPCWFILLKLKLISL